MPVKTEQEENQQFHVLHSTILVAFSYLNEDLAFAELVLRLNKFGCPDYVLMEILEWCRCQYAKGFNFNPRAADRRLFLRRIRGLLSNTFAKPLLPYNQSVYLTGFVDPVVIPCFDFVAHMFNILDDPRLITNKTMDLDWEDLFNLAKLKSDPSTGHRDEAQSGSVFQTYLAMTVASTMYS